MISKDTFFIALFGGYLGWITHIPPLFYSSTFSSFSFRRLVHTGAYNGVLGLFANACREYEAEAVCCIT